MTEDLATRRRPVPIAIVALLALLGALLVTATGHDHADADEGMGHEHVMTTATAQDASYASPAGMAMDHAKTARLITRKQARFHDAMRKLWEDHVTWTRLAIVTFAAGTPGFDTTAARLLQNQVDIGDAIKPFYGKKAGNALTSLLHDHITIAVEVMQAAKSGDTDAFNEANKRWYTNANAVADFLHKANPSNWGKKMMRQDMRVHLDQTLREAADELGGKYAAGVREDDHVHKHILKMADMLSSGIIAQFPGRFR
jgi:hypothetical protein